jgi:hypothetical protein
MGWTMLYLFVFLKLPIAAAAWLVWWAVHQEPDVEGDDSGGGGSRPQPHPRPRRPRPSRRGPHGDPELAAPPRVRHASPAARPRERQP